MRASRTPLRTLQSRARSARRLKASTGTRSQASGPRLDVSARVSSKSSYVLARSLVKRLLAECARDMPKCAPTRLPPRLGALLVQWQSLFSEPGLDPVRDVDRLLVIGPELRAAGRGLAVVQHHLDATQIQGALEHLRAMVPSGPAQEHFLVCSFRPSCCSPRRIASRHSHELASP